MDFSFTGDAHDSRFKWFADGLMAAMERNGHIWVDDPQDAALVTNFFHPGKPRSFRRKAQAVFLISVTASDELLEHAIYTAYPSLVRSLANLLITLVDEGGTEPTAHFLTPEQGHYTVSGDLPPREYFDAVYARIHPLATSQLVINNIYETNLPEDLWDGDEITRSIHEAGRRLDDLDLLPTPFPMHEVLPERDIKHIKRLYGLGGLSYGNISARKDETTFWMSASGVDKSNLKEIGRDILLVKDYDPERNAMILSVPPGIDPRRVSVDAIEHWMVYREHPGVGAIIHVHAWMDGIEATEFNYPCGTYELGQAVADIVRAAPDPNRAVVGLKNHGVTITGLSLEEIFERVGGKLIQPVPMS
jgi:ribulose-5-phosphate 4-epimerase/fuculose-1-phosphate aldolase